MAAVENMHRLCVFCTPLTKPGRLIIPRPPCVATMLLSREFSLSKGFLSNEKGRNIKSLGLRRYAHVKAEERSLLVYALHSHFFKKRKTPKQRKNPTTNQTKPKRHSLQEAD